MWHAWGTSVMHTTFWLKSMKGQDHSEEIGIDVSNKMDLRETGQENVN
jgi:hypothetical protein